MDEQKALELAIAALESEADETYQSNEIEGDPDLQAWQQERYDAIDVLQQIKEIP